MQHIDLLQNIKLPLDLRNSFDPQSKYSLAQMAGRGFTSEDHQNVKFLRS